VTAAATTAAKTSRAIVRLLISLSATDRRAPLRLHFYLIGLFPATLRLLDSAALVLRDACAAEDYRAVKEVVGVYIGSNHAR
jgi:hypothetical protein